MTLLELLVKELPKRGGWPGDDINTIEMHNDGEVFFNGGRSTLALPLCSDGWRGSSDKYSYDSNTDSGFYSNEVTRDQYEAALAASKQPVWDGEGLPPVGLRIEYTCKRFSEHKQAIRPEYWYGGVVIAYYEGFVWTSDNGLRPLENTIFRPTPTEAERQREETVEIMRSRVTNYNKTDVIQAIGEIYDAIGAGKIPGVKLDT